MKNIVFQTKELAKAIKKSNEYNQYQRIRQNLKKDMELFDRVQELRKRNFELQSRSDIGNMFDEIERLNSEFSAIMKMPVVNEFLMAEQRLCKMMQEVYSSLSDGLDFELGFLEK